MTSAIGLLHHHLVAVLGADHRVRRLLDVADLVGIDHERRAVEAGDLDHGGIGFRVCGVRFGRRKHALVVDFVFFPETRNPTPETRLI
jgi:hypothetical protein